jgi:polyisoprenoid-binding protein YceI
MRQIRKIFSPALVIASTLVMSFGSPAQAAKKTIDLKSTELKFLAVGKPGFLKIKGESKTQPVKGRIEVSDSTVSGELQLNLEGLETGISLRDEHLKYKYLEVKKFPIATLKLVNQPLSKDAETKFKGVLSLHGVDKEIQGTYKIDSSSSRLQAQFTFLVTDFAIDIPSYMGVTVSEKVDVDFAATIAGI